jgi:hypothetical protein
VFAPLHSTDGLWALDKFSPLDCFDEEFFLG